ncbi:SDR family NAD(P)-dependent oxidoreductase [Pelagovum pacificum]|uniref:SDR family NAD(P)-dependent oxidoreductase n=1 Tax=Pelagovum pacificum TaxID=2588711 RepID=A0A5C5G7S4_9RHOB|nr:SDR family NAD(P)-dependent oxidoreductase [Pelagovum pacificum]QQA41799.1 SDR family NAD(P)-dependent oxidoreductase [Pelagovum pacificum]TNY30759.1 SDR family NAD(P)-dependent oxidoreductase [Pelagovum pacificum]
MRVLVTGASRGIGAALLLAYRERGDTALGTSRSGDGLIRLDVTDPAAFAGLPGEVGDSLDLLVCNAGIFPDRHDEIDTGYDAAKWADVFATNVTGAFLTVQTLLPQLRAAKGKVAIISSQMGASTKAGGDALIYRASKAASANLALNLSKSLKPDGIAVGAYHPGWVSTDMTSHKGALQPEEAAQGLVARFDALDLETTGCFMTWDGQPHPF